MDWQYYIKAAAAVLIVIIGGLAAVIAGDMTFADVTTSQWLVVVGAALAEFVAIIGLQRAPATVSTSVKE
jgi:hypothetical protein